ncbi:MAG: hypothetical protein WD512_00725, partial [Candidatus Paceibacterota bacterium]
IYFKPFKFRFYLETSTKSKKMANTMKEANVAAVANVTKVATVTNGPTVTNVTNGPTVTNVTNVVTTVADNICIINLNNAMWDSRLEYYFPSSKKFGMPAYHITVREVMDYRYPYITVIVMSDNAIWNNNPSHWIIDPRFPHILTMKCSGNTLTLNCDDLKTLNKILDFNILNVPKILRVFKPDWWSEFLNDLYSLDSETVETNGKTLVLKKFKWLSQNPHTLLKVPDGVRSMKINIKDMDTQDRLGFIKKDGYNVIFDNKYLGHISSIDMSLPYIWIGIPPETEYISCTTFYVYKFSHVSRNYYRPVDSYSFILPRDYQLVQKGSISMLKYSEKNEKHDPPIKKTGVLIMGQS